MVPKLMDCSECGCLMRWHERFEGRKRVISLQHWMDGRMSLICLECNARRNYSEDVPPDGYKRCHVCGDTKLHSEFYYEARNRLGISSGCKPCIDKKNRMNYFNATEGLVKRQTNPRKPRP